jgi:hypothetical protein
MTIGYRFPSFQPCPPEYDVERELPMASARSHLHPPALLEQTDHVAHLHRHQANGTPSRKATAAAGPLAAANPVVAVHSGIGRPIRKGPATTRIVGLARQSAFPDGIVKRTGTVTVSAFARCGDCRASAQRGNHAVLAISLATFRRKIRFSGADRAPAHGGKNSKLPDGRPAGQSSN